MIGDRSTTGPMPSPRRGGPVVETPDAAATLAALERDRPDLADPFRAALPGARAAVLARLWGAFDREPIAGLGDRHRAGGRRTIAHAGHTLAGDEAAAAPFAAPPPGFAVTLDGRPYDDPARLLIALSLPGACDQLAAELANSVANLALARAARPATDGGPGLRRLAAMDALGALAAAEQWVVDGHPLHPCCRTRTGMSTMEVLAYAPEHRPLVDLELIEVPAGRWLATGAGLPPLLPVHPWQRDHVLDAYPGLRPTGRHRAARPLMSLRTLAPLDDPAHHLKTAVDVQMTSATRTVSPAAVHNGPAITALLRELSHRIAGFEVLAEPAAGAVLVDGEPCRSLAVVVREAPRTAPGEVALPLAALAAHGRPLAAEAVNEAYGGDPVAFFAALVGVVLPPLLALLRAGVALEAHGQNTLVVLRAGRPVRLLYRDVGGVRVSPARLRAAGVQPPPLHGDLACDDPVELRTKLTAAVGVALAEQVAVLARHHAVAPKLLADVVRRTGALPDGPLPVKATTAMRLADDPLADRWTRLDDPWGDAA